MEKIQNVLPLIIVFTVFYGALKKVPVFSCFVEGAKKGLNQAAVLLPSLTALVAAVSMLLSSGGAEILAALLAPVVRLFGIPEEVLPLCLITPLSGSGTLAVLEKILSEFSPDSYVGRVASVVAGASETTFYAITVYYGSVGITKTRHTVPSALTADFACYLAAAISCRYLR